MKRWVTCAAGDENCDIQILKQDIRKLSEQLNQIPVADKLPELLLKNLASIFRLLS